MSRNTHDPNDSGQRSDFMCGCSVGRNQQRNEAVLKAMSQTRCGWGSWHMELIASKCTGSLLNLWESCICLKIKRLKMTLSSQTPLIRKPLRRAYATISILYGAKENQGRLRTSQMVEPGAAESNRPGTCPLLPENRIRVSLRNLPPHLGR